MSINPEVNEPPVRETASDFEPAAAAPAQGTSGLAITGFILAFFLPLIGFILSLVAVFKTGSGRRKGRGLAVAGIIISVLIMAAGGVAVAVFANTVGKNAATVLDPGCTAGKDVIMNTASMPSDPEGIKSQLKTAIDGLNSAAAKAQHADVRNAMKALADDYSQLLQAINTQTQPPATLEATLTSDAQKIDSLCTLGGAGK